MKRSIKSILSVGIPTLCLLMTGCDDDKIFTTDYTLVHPIDKIIFNCVEGDEYPMTPGMTYQIEYSVGPDEVDDSRIIFKSSDESVITVTQDGLVTAISTGDATVTATPPIGFGASATLLFHVKDKVVLAQSIDVEIDGTPAEFYYESDQLQLNATILPADHDYNHLVWKSSDENYATVDQNGLVTLIKEGDVTITASATDGSNVSGSWSGHVFKMVDVDDLTIAPLAESVCIDRGSFDLDVKYLPLGSTAGSVKWESSNEEVAVVERGRVRPVGFGVTTITGTAPSGKSASVEVRVTSGLRIWDAENKWRQWIAGSNASFTYQSDCITVKMTEMSAGGNWRGDIMLPCSNDAPAWFDFGNYPIIAMRATIPANGRNTLDAVSIDGINCGGPQSNEGRFNTNTPIELKDGSKLYYYNISSKYSTSAPTGFSLFQIKVADIPAADVPASKSYNLYWVRTFKSMDEMKAFAEAEVAAGK